LEFYDDVIHPDFVSFFDDNTWNKRNIKGPPSESNQVYKESNEF
jgi:hypothetical protein